MKFSQAKSIWSATPIGRRIGVLTVILTLGFGGWMAFTRVTAPTYAVLYGNMTDTQASTVLAKLDAKGIPHKVEGNGTRILVPSTQLVTARLALAADGVTAQAVPEGWSILDKEGLATSDMRQRIDYQRALEGELSKTLMAMDAITTATVHLTLPDKPIYAGSKSDAGSDPTASVLVGLRRQLSADETETISNLVASAVQGLTPANITVAATDGTVLHAPGDASAAGAMSTAKAFKATQDFETAQSAKLTALARQLTQRPDATVVVHAQLDFSEVSTESETVDPAKQVPTADHSLKETWTGSGSAVGGGTVGVDGGPLPAASNGQSGDYLKEEKTTTYSGGRTVTKTVEAPGKVKQMSVAVVVPFSNADGGPSIDPAEVQRVVGAAAALDTTRGDTIEVASVGVTDTVPTSVPTTAAPVTTGGLPIPILAGAAVGLAFLAFVFGRRRSKKKSRRAAVRVDQAEIMPGAWSQGPAVTPAARTAANEIKADLDRLATETPESLAALLAGWLTKN